MPAFSGVPGLASPGGLVPGLARGEALPPLPYPAGVVTITAAGPLSTATTISTTPAATLSGYTPLYTAVYEPLRPPSDATVTITRVPAEE